MHSSWAKLWTLNCRAYIMMCSKWRNGGTMIDVWAYSIDDSHWFHFQRKKLFKYMRCKNLYAVQGSLKRTVVNLFRVTLGRSPQVAPKHNMADIYPDYEPGLYVGLENDFLLESGQGDPIFLLGDFLPGSFQNFCQNSSELVEKKGPRSPSRRLCVQACHTQSFKWKFWLHLIRNRFLLEIITTSTFRCCFQARYFILKISTTHNTYIKQRTRILQNVGH